VRFSLEITPDGKWFEIGEISRGDSPRQEFFEITLRRDPT